MQINVRFLKDGADVIKSAVTHIINLSLETGVVSNELKWVIVKPLYKKGSSWCRQLQASKYFIYNTKDFGMGAISSNGKKNI